MDRPDMEMVVAVEEAGTLGAAARRLHTAQPALSRRLAALERRLGGRLFDRGRHGAVPTAAGRLLAERCRAALAATRRAEDDARAVLRGEAGTLRIGAAPTLGAELLPTALAHHRATNPDVRIELDVSGDSPGLRRRVADGGLDVAVVVLGDRLEPGLRVATSAPQTLVVALPPGHALAGRSRVPRADLADAPLVTLGRGNGLRVVLDELFADLGATPRITLEVDERELLLPFVAAGLGATLLPERFARARAGDAVALRPLSPPLTRRVGAVTRASHDLLVDAFTRTLRRDWPAG